MAEIDYVEEFQKANLHIVSVIKNTAELLVVTGLFSFIGKAYQSPQATVVSTILLFALGAYISASIQHYTLMIPRLGKKYHGWLFGISVLAAFAIATTLQIFVLAPTIKAIERQLAATPPALQLQAAPSPAGNQGQTSAGTAAPKPSSAPSAAAAAAPAPSVPPSAAPSRSNSPEARKPD